MTTIKKTDLAPRHQVIDSCLLGRPVHLLHVFAAQLREDLAGAMRLPMSRRYWGGLQVESVGFGRAGDEPGAARWLGFQAGANRIGFSIERQVLLGVLNYRYGRSPAAAAPAEPSVDPAHVRVTATEERLAVLLGQQLSGTLAARVRANLAAAGQGAPAANEPLEPGPGGMPPKGAWLIAVEVADPEGDNRGRFWFALDKLIMADVLHGLLPERKQVRKAAGNGRSLASQLQLRLEGRLISKQMQLGSLFDLRVGDIIPISLHRTEVLLEESALFTAAVSEHKGKLCLTSFVDIE
jgi:flagellar motor switch protein FliM